jgi:hypothetical protein
MKQANAEQISGLIQDSGCINVCELDEILGISVGSAEQSFMMY